MFRHHRKDTPEEPIASSRARSVRVLEGEEELHAAVERAMEFERRRADEYQRRVGTYDRFLNGEAHSDNVVPIDSSAEAS